MNNLVIELSLSSVETVSNAIIEKLYQFAKTSNVENENNNFPMSLSGNILSPHAYEDAVLYLRLKFPNLIINVLDNNYYIRFADSEVERVLVGSSLCSDGVGISIADANLATLIPQDLFKENQAIKTFNELNRFGSVIIGKNAFLDCHELLEVNLSTVTQIRENGFRGCEALNLEISIPNLTLILALAFRYCTLILRVTNLGDTITSLPEACFLNCTSLTEINIPDSVTSLGGACFHNCTSLTEISIPDGVTALGGSCFYNCSSLTEINIPDGVTILNNNCFQGCSSLTEISIPNGVTSLGGACFSGCSNLTEINIPSSVNSIGESCFARCSSLTEINIPNGITSLGNNCFLDCSNLTEISIPNVTSLGGSCFRNNSSLIYLDLSNITSIGSSAFFECLNFIGNSIEDPTLRIPNLSGDLGAAAFRRTKITQISDLGNITSIGKNAKARYYEGSFVECTSLTSITIPSTVTIIGADAFSNCYNLSNININWNNIISLGSSAFGAHPNWDFIINLSNCTTFGKSALGISNSGKTFVKLLYIPKLQYGDNSSMYSTNYSSKGIFKGTKTDLLYLRDIEAFYPGDFCHTDITCLVINNITPPEWRNTYDEQDSEVTDDSHRKHRVFSSSTIANIYVPDSVVSTYQSDSNWSTVYDKIKPLSQLTKVATEADLQSGQIALIEAYM